MDLCVCHRRNTHNHSKEHIAKIVNAWERTPRSYTKVDLTPLAQDAGIEEVRLMDREVLVARLCLVFEEHLPDITRGRPAYSGVSLTGLYGVPRLLRMFTMLYQRVA